MLRNIVFLSKISGMNEELKELYREIKVDNETDNGINEKKKWKRYLYVFLAFFDILVYWFFYSYSYKIRFVINNIKCLIKSDINF